MQGTTETYSLSDETDMKVRGVGVTSETKSSKSNKVGRVLVILLHFVLKI